jgi:hypothetical protein
MWSIIVVVALTSALVFLQGGGSTWRARFEASSSERRGDGPQVVAQVVDINHCAGISRKCVRLKPLISIKG